ncbi:hypothetical protein SK128_018868 [Halocaridina rubra]|uniref:Sulfotransferase domain-containing protein n=1 Tax=Halocaridina rubra TaxID=373956 RepID=A0AAN8X8T2_HALRR
MKTASKHDLENVEGEELQRLEKYLRPTSVGMVRLTPGEWLYPGGFRYSVDKIYNFPWRNHDVVLMGLPKTGTTWMQEILWTMRNNPNLDHADGNLPILTRVPIIE